MLSNIKKRISSMILLVLCILCILVPVKSAYASGISGSASGISTASQTVYSGPSTSYTTVGSIGNGEYVSILNKERDLAWYHIVYTVNNTTSQKCGYVPLSGLTSISGNVYDQEYIGYQGYSTASQNVYSSPSRDIVAGSISNGEGVTVLEERANGFANVYFIEYSTSSGPKRGYVYGNIYKVANTGVARVTTTADLYYSHYTSGYQKAGTVYANEYVTVLAKEGDWVYVEYNTNSGRKRGYFSTGYLSYHSRLGWYNDLYDTSSWGDTWVDGTKTVYAGPSSTYANVGSVGNEVVRLYYGYLPYNGYYYIEYNTSSGLKKTGWIAMNLPW